ncbi:serine hydrolase [Dactylosporangium roseum]|uniref:Serine hydrolase n=1 Tax=Dactylosporangium roseum TaxID=47989 RepID=A0ABY5ZA53_9ACTN|nr:serine hydrolase domain-containing protein [Dactylosporangium roseum]UWZ38921.1 serine hydrolase [Dactylosporangium roseum]
MTVARRTVLGTGLAAAGALLAGCGRAAPATGTARPVGESAGLPGAEGSAAGSPSASMSGSAAPPGFGKAPKGRATSPAELTFTPGRVVRPLGATAAYGATLTQVMTRYLAPAPDNPKYPGYAGAVALVAVDGQVTAHTAVGHALRYGTGPVELPSAQRVPMRRDAIFDLASITKVFTALLVLQLADQGKVDLDAPVVRYLPEFTGAGKDAITVAMVLAHTGALPGGVSFSGLATVADRWAKVVTAPLVGGGVPGNTFRYSGVGLMVLGRLVEKVAGQALDAAVRDRITGPLGMRDTMFKPLNQISGNDPRLVATEARKARGLTRGVVHDDLCLALGGVAGHAGMFGTASDLAVLGQMLINGGEYGGRRILSEKIVRRMLVNANRGLPAIDAERPGRSSTHGLGVELQQPWFMGKLARPLTFGHTGFTGTSWLVDPDRRVVVVLLTNRAHPDWTRADPDKPRVAVADALAAGLG